MRRERACTLVHQKKRHSMKTPTKGYCSVYPPTVHYHAYAIKDKILLQALSRDQTMSVCRYPVPSLLHNQATAGVFLLCVSQQ